MWKSQYFLNILGNIFELLEFKILLFDLTQIKL